MNSSIATAIAGVASQIDAALLNGHSTRELRAEMATLEQQQRRENTERTAADFAIEAERLRAEEAEEAAAAAALTTAIEARLQARLAALAPPPPPLIRRAPTGVYVAPEGTEE